MRLIPASRAVLPSSQSRRHPCRRRAPSAEMCEILILVLMGDCASSFLSCTDPRRTGDPQKMADRWRGRPRHQNQIPANPSTNPSAPSFSLKRKQEFDDNLVFLVSHDMG